MTWKSKTTHTLLIFVCVLFWGLFLKVMFDKFNHTPKKSNKIKQEAFFQPQELAPHMDTTYGEIQAPRVYIYHQEISIEYLPVKDLP